MNPFHSSPQRKPHPALSAQELDATEALIEHALGTLRDAQPEAGMEARLLAALEHRNGSVATSLRERFFSRLHSPQLVLGAGVAVVIALLVIVPLRVHRRATPSVSTRSSRARATEEAAAENAMPFFRTKAAKREKISRETLLPARSLRHAPGHSLEIAAVPQSRASTPSADNADALALAELHTPSRPVSPLPLTAQERILLRVANHPNSTQVAALNPVQRASLDDHELADFRHFFWKPLLPQPTVPSVVPTTLTGDTNAQ